jgi:uncharacterized membrane protein YheB (UPF0754 family)
MDDFHKIDAFFKTLEEKTMSSSNNNDITISDKHTSVMFFKVESNQLAVASKNTPKNKEEAKKISDITCYIVTDEVEDVDKQGHIVDNGELYFLKNSEYLYLDNDIKRLKYLYTNEEIKIISYIFIMKYTVNFFKRHDWNNYRIHKISCSSVKEQTIIIPSVSFYYQRNMLKDDINSDIMNYCENRPQQNLPIELMKRNYNISHEKYFNVITRTTEDDIVAKRLKLNSKY